MTDGFEARVRKAGLKALFEKKIVEANDELRRVTYESYPYQIKTFSLHRAKEIIDEVLSMAELIELENRTNHP